MSLLIMVLVASFVAVAAAAKIINKNKNTNIDMFELGGGCYYEVWWEDAGSITALREGIKVTLKGYSIGTDATGNFLWEAEDGVCYTLYGHHLVAETVWNH